MIRRTTTGGERSVVVVGDDPIAATVAGSLSDDVLFVGPDQWTVGRVRDDVADTAVVENVADYRPADTVDAAIVATRSDSTNLLLAQQFRLVDAEVLVLLNDRANRQAFDGIDAEIVCASTCVGESITEHHRTQMVSTK